MAVSSLATVSVPAYAGNYTKGRNNTKIRCITIHHMAGVMTAEGCGKIFQAVGRNGSSHYGIGNDGKIGSYVDEDNIAWTNSNWSSNCESITIETSNSSLGGEWPVSDAAYASLIKLVADIAKRHNLGKLVVGDNLTYHSMFVATSCPGDYLRARMQNIADTANSINSGHQNASTGQIVAPTAKKSNEEIADEIIAGKWGNDPERKNALIAAGYDRDAIQSIVDRKLKGTVSAAPAKSTELNNGDKVLPIEWVAYNGVRIIKTRNYYFATEVKATSDRVVLRADSVSGVVYAAIKKSNLKKV